MPNFIFIFYSEPLEKYWVVPSTAIVEHGYRAPSKMDEPVYTVRLAKKRKLAGNGFQHLETEAFQQYVGDFDLIERTAKIDSLYE